MITKKVKKIEKKDIKRVGGGYGLPRNFQIRPSQTFKRKVRLKAKQEINAQVALLQEEISQLNADSLRLEAQKNVLQRKLQQMRHQEKRLTQKLDQELFVRQQQQARLKGQLKKRWKELKAGKKNMKQKQKAHMGLQQQYQALNQIKHGLDDQAVQLFRINKQLNLRVQRLEGEIQYLRESIRVKQQQLYRLQLFFQSNSAQIIKLEANINHCDSIIIGLRNVLNHANQLASQRQQQLNRANQRANQQQQRLNYAIQRANQQQQQLNHINQLANQRQRDLNHAISFINTKQRHIEELKAIVDQTNTSVKELTAQIEAIKRQKDNIIAQIKAKQSQQKTFLTEMHKLKRSQQHLSSQKQLLIAEKDHLQQKIDLLDAQNATLRIQMSAQIQARRSIISQLQELQSQIPKEDLTSLLDAKLKLQNQVMRLQHEYLTAMHAIGENERQISYLQSYIGQLLSESELLKSNANQHFRQMTNNHSSELQQLRFHLQQTLANRQAHHQITLRDRQAQYRQQYQKMAGQYEIQNAKISQQHRNTLDQLQQLTSQLMKLKSIARQNASTNTQKHQLTYHLSHYLSFSPPPKRTRKLKITPIGRGQKYQPPSLRPGKYKITQNISQTYKPPLKYYHLMKNFQHKVEGKQKKNAETQMEHQQPLNEDRDDQEAYNSPLKTPQKKLHNAQQQQTAEKKSILNQFGQGEYILERQLYQGQQTLGMCIKGEYTYYLHQRITYPIGSFPVIKEMANTLVRSFKGQKIFLTDSSIMVMVILDVYKDIPMIGFRHYNYYAGDPQPTRYGFNLKISDYYNSIAIW